MSSATVGDHDLYYERSGSGDPLLLIMGMSGTHLTWGDPFLEALRRDFEVVIYDHRGIGKSSRAEANYSIADLADDAAGLLDAIGWERPHIVGISMGGMIGQELALRHPERVRTLTLGCTAPGGDGSVLTPAATLQRLQDSWASGDREVALRTAWEVNVAPGFAGEEEPYADFRRQALEVPAALSTIMAQMQACVMHDAGARLDRITAPTLVIHGTADEMLPVGNAKVIAERIPDARLEILDGVGHLFFWEEPERSAALVREHAHAPTRA
jgi:3-oxoadipate enol-lactonase